jgi:ferrous iron transport protein A
MWGRRRRRRRGALRRVEGELTLDHVRSGRRVRVVRVRGGRRLTQRLAALGLVPGSLVTVTRSRGPAIVAVGGARIAVGRQAAMAIEVEETGE